MTWWEFTDTDDWGGLPVVTALAKAGPRCRVVVTGTILSCSVAVERKAPTVEYLLDDGTGEIHLLFTGRRHVPGLDVGVRAQFEGTAVSDRDRLVVWNPLYRVGRRDQN